MVYRYTYIEMPPAPEDSYQYIMANTNMSLNIQTITNTWLNTLTNTDMVNFYRYYWYWYM